MNKYGIVSHIIFKSQTKILNYCTEYRSCYNVVSTMNLLLLYY